MIRGGSRSGRIACLLVGVSAALAAVVPTAASAQPAVDEYTLDIPGGGGAGGGGEDSPGGSAGVASASGGGAGGTEGAGGAGSSERGAGSGRRGTEGTASGGGGAARGEEIDSSLDGSGSTGAGGSLDTSSRSAPEVVADTLFDSAMLPILVALVLITGVGAWRLVRHRRTLSGHAS